MSNSSQPSPISSKSILKIKPWLTSPAVRSTTTAPRCAPATPANLSPSHFWAIIRNRVWGTPLIWIRIRWRLRSSIILQMLPVQYPNTDSQIIYTILRKETPWPRTHCRQTTTSIKWIKVFWRHNCFHWWNRNEKKGINKRNNKQERPPLGRPFHSFMI